MPDDIHLFLSIPFRGFPYTNAPIEGASSHHVLRGCVTLATQCEKWEMWANKQIFSAQNVIERVTLGQLAVRGGMKSFLASRILNCDTSSTGVVGDYIVEIWDRLWSEWWGRRRRSFHQLPRRWKCLASNSFGSGQKRQSYLSKEGRTHGLIDCLSRLWSDPPCKTSAGQGDGHLYTVRRRTLQK